MAMSADRRCGKPEDEKKIMADPQTHTDFSFDLNACVVQGSRDDRDEITSGPGVVEHVWIMSRPPRLGRGVEPTVSARRAHVMLTHVQGQMIDTGEIVCKKVCTLAGASDDKGSMVNTAQIRKKETCNRGQTCE